MAPRLKFENTFWAFNQIKKRKPQSAHRNLETKVDEAVPHKRIRYTYQLMMNPGTTGCWRATIHRALKVHFDHPKCFYPIYHNLPFYGRRICRDLVSDDDKKTCRLREKNKTRWNDDSNRPQPQAQASRTASRVDVPMSDKSMSAYRL